MVTSPSIRMCNNVQMLGLQQIKLIKSKELNWLIVENRGFQSIIICFFIKPL